ncbi:50S ribosomal protein L6 [Salinispira pacifica]|uniref:Large ribosomal subunit protein uL6 n=1 Tax=Salinispira pacifica TaxID=1307761 RepID=V5WGM1_9SPIO|nr:50S ribosomal protein L6 [Salinispira pacifica]AHC14311.1 LSU ribosomal protein L6p (L9e) [Salinispira pacifica]
MSRIGKLPVAIPQGVEVNVTDDTFTVKGPNGSLSQTYKPLVSFKSEDNQIVVTRKNESKEAKSLHGLYRNLLNNMVIGVTKGFERALIINGVGYRAEVKGQSILMNLGFSNQIEYVIPEGVEVQVEGQNKVIIKGNDKVLVGRVASEIRSLRPPEPYKGKGVRYEDERIRRKEGKTGIK